MAVGRGQLEAHGVKLMSIGFLAPAESAIVWRGPMASSALKQFITEVDWGELDYLLLDMPPGTGDIQMALARLLPQTEMLDLVIVDGKPTEKISDLRRTDRVMRAGRLYKSSDLYTAIGVTR